MPNLSSIRVTRPFYALAIASCIVGVTPPLFAGKSEERFEAQLAQRAANLEADLIGQAFTTEIAALTEMPEAGLVARFAPFRHHANNASRLDYKSQTVAPPEDAVTLSAETSTAIKRTLKTPEHLSGSSLRATLLVRIPREKAWRVLEALEIAQDFEGAAGFAKLMMNTEANETKRDLLALIAARNVYFDSAAGVGDPASTELAAIAAQSADETIAYHANLWIEAISAPVRLEGLNLAFHVWELIIFEKAYREQGATLSAHVASSLDRVLATVQGSQLDEETKQAQIARIASIGAEMGFQRSDTQVLAWSRNLVRGLTYGNPEDLLAPEYYYAYDHYARGRSLQAAEAAEPIFLSGVECDIAADAGRILAESLMRLDDDLAALATYELLRELYPNQTHVFEAINIRESHLKNKFGSEVNVVEAKIEERYGAQRKKILAAREHLKNREQAENKPEQKKLASSK